METNVDMLIWYIIMLLQKLKNFLFIFICFWQLMYLFCVWKSDNFRCY